MCQFSIKEFSVTLVYLIISMTSQYYINPTSKKSKLISYGTKRESRTSDTEPVCLPLIFSRKHICDAVISESKGLNDTKSRCLAKK